MQQATPPIPRSAPRPGSADWLLEREYVEHRDEVLGSVRKQLFGRGVTLDPADLEATYNSAWHVLHQKLSAGEQVANRQGLLVVIMVRRILSERRTLAGSNPPVPLDLLDGPVLSDRAPEPAQQVSDRQQVRQLLEGLRERLSDRELQAATLCYLHGYTRPDAARLLDVPPKRMEKLMDRVSREVSGVVRDVERGWCQANRSLITAYALGVLASSGPRHALAQDHLAHCAPCRRRVLVMRGMAALSPPAPLIGTGGGATVVAGAVGGGAAVTLGVGAPIGAGIAGALTGTAALVGTVVVLGGGFSGPAAPLAAATPEPRSAPLGVPPQGAETLVPTMAFVADAPPPATGSAEPRPPVVLPRPGAPAGDDAPASGPTAGGPPGPVAPARPAPRAPAPSVLGERPAVPPREERSSHAEGATATGSATGTTTDVTTDAGTADDGRRYGSAAATASGPSAQAAAGATAAGPGSDVDSRARAAGESTSPVDVGARVHAESGGTDPSAASGDAEAWAIGGTASATLSTAASTTADGDVPAAARVAAGATGPSASATSASRYSVDLGEGAAAGTATARSGQARGDAPSPYEIAVPADLVADVRWSASVAFFDAATQQQLQFDLSWLLAGLPAPGVTLAVASVGGSGLDSYSVSFAYGAGATTVATVTLAGGSAGAVAGTSDRRGWTIALATSDGEQAVATGDVRGEGDGSGAREALVDAGASTDGSASATALLLADDAGAPGPGARHAVEASALAQIARLLRPTVPVPESRETAPAPAADATGRSPEPEPARPAAEDGRDGPVPSAETLSPEPSAEPTTAGGPDRPEPTPVVEPAPNGPTTAPDRAEESVAPVAPDAPTEAGDPASVPAPDDAAHPAPEAGAPVGPQR